MSTSNYRFNSPPSDQRRERSCNGNWAFMLFSPRDHRLTSELWIRVFARGGSRLRQLGSHRARPGAHVWPGQGSSPGPTRAIIRLETGVRFPKNLSKPTVG
jgi:hypothetical protein